VVTGVGLAGTHDELSLLPVEKEQLTGSLASDPEYGEAPSLLVAVGGKWHGVGSLGAGLPELLRDH